MLSELLENGADVNAACGEDMGGVQALHVAAAKGATRCVEVLLAAGADANSPSEATGTPLDAAKEFGAPVEVVAAS